MLLMQELLFFLIPLAAVVFFVVSLCQFLTARSRNKKAPGSVPPDKLTLYRVLLIISSVIAGGMLAVVIGFIALLYMAVAFM